jgi:transcription-repair coupling factor (superfamily II helicase)
METHLPFSILKVYKDEHFDFDGLIARLSSMGYKRSARVEEEGDFAVRGGIVDVFPITFENPIRLEFSKETISSIFSFSPRSGIKISSHDIGIILPIKGVSPRKLKTKLFVEELPIDGFVDIESGDYVVHVNYGIGIYRGIEKIKAGTKYKDHIVVEYAEGDRLFFPIEELHLLQKYICFSHRAPRLSKLGSKMWQHLKDKAKKGVTSFAMGLLETQAKRAVRKGFAFSKDTEWQRELEKNFPFKETPAQTRALKEIKKDMESDRSMERLLLGDAGYGKTEVALRAAFKAVMDGKQVAVLAPTTVLVEQHFTTFAERMKKYPLEIRMLSRFKSKDEQKAIVEDLRKGNVDIIIATHRLLSKDIRFKDLGLLIIDEEQRFGVTHKEKLKSISTHVDVLVLTATPIPRTLYMALVGARDMSIIDTPPENRLAVKTFVRKFDDDVVRTALDKELARKGQVYFVNNKIAGLEAIARRLSVLVPKASIRVAHGQMEAKELEQIMIEFVKGSVDILVSTAIVQSGIDVPNANTIIVNNAHDFGLGDLHQLRGRVGRFDRHAYAYFIIPERFILESDAQKRMNLILKHDDLGSGFTLAMADLQMRGAGNILGTQQHGYVEAIGFDLYCRLLRNAIESFKKK